MNFQFKPMEFINNLKYMGIGMLGVLMIVAIIMLSTYLINWTINRLAAVKSLEEDSDSED